jgi:hypothetical protein
VYIILNYLENTELLLANRLTGMGIPGLCLIYSYVYGNVFQGIFYNAPSFASAVGGLGEDMTKNEALLVIVEANANF